MKRGLKFMAPVVPIGVDRTIPLVAFYGIVEFCVECHILIL